MRTRDILHRAARSLRQAKVRTLLTSLAIAVGAFTLTLALAAAQGARDYADRLISSNIDPQTLFIVKDKAIIGAGEAQTGLREYDPNVTTQQGATIKALNQDDVKALKARDDLEQVRPIYDVSATYIRIEGFDTRYASDLSVYNPGIRSDVTAGELPVLGTDIEENQIVIPASFAETLKVPAQSLIGRKITLVVERAAAVPSETEIQQIIASEGAAGLARLSQQTESKEITLIIAATTRASQFSFTSSSAMQIPISQAEAIADFTTKGTDAYQKYFALTANVVEGTAPADVKAALEKEGFYPQTADDLQGFLFIIINTLLGIVGGFGLLALIASVFGIVNTQYISVLERTQQIGLMKALGASRRDVRRLFRYEAAWIGFLGGVIGAGLGWLVGLVANPYISEWLELDEGTYLLVFDPISIVILILVLMIIAVLAGYFPARKAALLDPIEALRTE